MGFERGEARVSHILTQGQDIQNLSLYMQGVKDCKNGEPHSSGKGEAYDQGYADQYEIEQVIGAENV